MNAPSAEVLLRSPDDRVVADVARAVAASLGAAVRPATAADGPALAQELGHRGVLTVASRADDVGWAVVERAGKPVLLVPVAVDRVAPRLRRVLAPLDGTPDAAAVLSASEEFLVGELVVLHVFGPRAVPRFWDDATHAEQAWAQEFRARWCDRPATRVELRTGPVPDRVREVARDEGADLIVLGRPRRAADAALVRRTVTEAETPVLLVPTDRPAR